MGAKEKKDKAKKIGPAAPSAKVADDSSVGGGQTAAQVREAWDEKSQEEKNRVVSVTLQGIAPSVPTDALQKPAEVIDPNNIPSATLQGIAPSVPTDALQKPAVQAPESTSSSGSMVELYKMLNPEPKRRTPEEQAEYERQRRASGIILGISDAINGLSNLGATVAGAPSRNITPIAGKWAEVLDRAEKERQQRYDVWKSGLMKAHIDDFNYARSRAAATADAVAKERQTAIELQNAKELAKYKADLDHLAREHEAAIDAEQAKTEHGYTIAEIGARAAASPEKPDLRKTYFSAVVGGQNVDVRLRSAEDYNRLYDILKPYIEEADPLTEMRVIDRLAKGMDEKDPDIGMATSMKKDFVRKYFNKYYYKIKDSSDFKHLDIQFTDSEGNPITPRGPREKLTPLEMYNTTQGIPSKGGETKSFSQAAYDAIFK